MEIGYSPNELAHRMLQGLRNANAFANSEVCLTLYAPVANVMKGSNKHNCGWSDSVDTPQSLSRYADSYRQTIKTRVRRIAPILRHVLGRTRLHQILINESPIDLLRSFQHASKRLIFSRVGRILGGKECEQVFVLRDLTGAIYNWCELWFEFREHDADRMCNTLSLPRGVTELEADKV